MKIDYIEFYAQDLEAVKQFYQAAFGWEFTDYGLDYTAFAKSGIEGGFEKVKERPSNGALIVLYSEDLESAEQKVIMAGGKILVPIFSFPGGRRFQFEDPAGNQLAVWTKTNN